MGPGRALDRADFVHSTDSFSSDHTSRVIEPWIRWLFPAMSPLNVDWLHMMIRKSAHVTEYGIFALLIARALLSSSWPFLTRGWFVIGMGLLLAMAASDEFHQRFVPRRTSTPKDVLIDMCGGVAALTVVALWRAWRRRRTPG